MKTETLTAFFFALICVTFGQLKTGRGAYDGRIVGGVDIRIEEAPYQVSLQYFNSHMCGGSIISKTFVVTAAHCTFGFAPRYFSIRAGSTKNYEGGEVHKVMNIINHPFFNRKTLDFDVALLKMQTIIRINDRNIQEIGLPYAGEPLPETTPILISGWGETRNVAEDSRYLRAVIVEVTNQYKCHQAYLADGGVTPRMVCAYAVKKDSCSGDSGGPARRLSDGKLVGLVSFGPGNECAVDGVPGVYTRVASIRSWIYFHARV